ncbi:hypothetical protein, partial [Clostridioides difficile]|uniref:hypothetical protein n=1 Tax=Clostridioides difficile TaxID=1496 RepID=UPI003A95558B
FIFVSETPVSDFDFDVVVLCDLEERQDGVVQIELQAQPEQQERQAGHGDRENPAQPEEQERQEV